MNASPPQPLRYRLRTVLWEVALLVLLTGMGCGAARADDNNKGTDAQDKKIDKPLIKIPRVDLPTKAELEAMVETPPKADNSTKPEKPAKATKIEKATRPEAPKKPAKPEKPEKPEHTSKFDPSSKADITATTSSDPKAIGAQLREALSNSIAPHKKLTLVISGKGAMTSTPAKNGNGNNTNNSGTPQRHPAHTATPGLYAPIQIPAYTPVVVTWSYEGSNGPTNWGKLKPEFGLCSLGQRQSPIHIQENDTLHGPAEPITFHYTPSRGNVVDDGHTIHVDVDGDNTLTIRSTTYHLTEINFHTPAETQINGNRAPLSVQLIHKNDEGQLAVLAVQFELGEANALVDKVWTYLPLDAADHVPMPNHVLNAGEILPTDQHYFQFIGSLTTPPCIEGVLWIVMKQPLTISPAQYRLFTQLFPMNARPTQPLNGRPVREAD